MCFLDIMLFNTLGPQGSVNTTFMCTGMTSKHSCDSLYCNICFSGSPELNPQYLWGMPIMLELWRDLRDCVIQSYSSYTWGEWGAERPKGTCEVIG